MSAWSKEECNAIVEDYFAMLLDEMRREEYSKAQHRRDLLPRLNSRSEGSIEFKHQNISAILTDLEQTCIDGYKPMSNYQALLREVVVERLEHQQGELAAAVETAEFETDASDLRADWQTLQIEAPEPSIPTHREMPHAKDHHSQYSISRQESLFKALGESGEKFVLELEKARLESFDRADLAQEIEWTSKVRGDGTGFDIRSFDVATENELFIEVKTTRFSRYTPFYISANEVDFSHARAEQYALYRVFNFGSDARYFSLPGDIQNRANLRPQNYRASFI
ncbi:MAG: DUF3883 domain-containing protein [Gammaproteobacteria bacterium]|nr:DUF3883 domain-containing protein [Gammaproteobacteria bacterium]